MAVVDHTLGGGWCEEGAPWWRPEDAVLDWEGKVGEGAGDGFVFDEVEGGEAGAVAGAFGAVEVGGGVLV